MANNLKESKGVLSQKEILTAVRCPVCHQLMRQNEIGIEIAFRHARKRADRQAHQELQGRLESRGRRAAAGGHTAACGISRSVEIEVEVQRG
jgi:hypothetical protein